MKTLLKITTFLMMLLTSFSLQAQYNAGTGSGTSGSSRTFVGFYAGRVNTGAYNSFFGRDAGYNNTAARYGTFLGRRAGFSNTTGEYNSFIGANAGYTNTTGTSNSFIGVNAGYANTAGANNTFAGVNSGRFNTTGSSNSFFGVNAGYANTTGVSNTFTGINSGRFNTIGNYNNFSGVNAGYSNTTGSNNSFFGVNAGYANTIGVFNTFLGTNSGRFNTTARYGTFIGRRAGFSNTTGEYNSFIGANAGYNNTTGTSNNFVGVNAGYANTTGSSNSVFGTNAGRFNTAGSGNTFLGHLSGYNATGSSNVFIGYGAGYNETGNNKLYIDNSTTATPLIEGDFSANALTLNGTVGVNGHIPTGSAIPTDIKLYVNGRFSQRVAGSLGGFGSGDRWSSLGNSFIPGVATPTIYGMFNQGFGASFISGSKSGANNLVGFTGNRLDFDVISMSGPTTTVMSILNGGNVGIGFTNPQYKLDINGDIRVVGSYIGSDKRYKENIKGIENAMDKINALDGVTYDFKAGEINGYNFKTITDKKQIGFIAQDVKKVLPELVDADENNYLSVNYVAIIPVLVEAIKEQQDVIDEQEILIDEQQQEMLQQKEQITDLQSRMERLEALLTDSENIQGSLLPSNVNTNIAGVMLRQNAPNPFSERTTIQYELPDNLGVASLVVYDLNSRQIATYSIAGKGSIEFNASGLPNGTYGYTILVNGKSVASQKMIIQK